VKSLILITVVVKFLISSFCQAHWISEVDKKYQQRSPAQYAKVAKAKDLITNSNGNTPQIYEAIELLTVVTKKYPKFAPAYLQLGRAASTLGIMPYNMHDKDSQLSLEQFVLKALEIEPNYEYAIALLGYAKMNQGKLDEAEKYFMQAAKMGYPYTKTRLAQLSNKRGESKKALEFALEAYEQDKTTPNLAASAINEIVLAYECLPGDNAPEEEKWIEKRREIVPSAWNWQAHASFRLYRLGDYEKSIEYGKKALSIMNFGMGQYTLAAAYYKKWNDLKDKPARSDEANEAFKIASAIHPITRDMIQDFMNFQATKSTGEALLKRTPPGP